MLDALLGLIGTEIAKMHLADIIHGDLTTSNMMLRRPSSSATELVGTLPAYLAPVRMTESLSYLGPN